jgi:nucleotide-binding universal stress UspA family protein
VNKKKLLTVSISYAVWSPDKEEIMFKKILVPLDGSDLAAKILPQVETLAKHTNAAVTLLIVGTSNICEGEAAPAQPVKTGAACPELPIASYLEQATAQLRSRGVEVNWVYKQGKQPAHEIVAYADDHRMDLIAIASHGGGEFAWLLGSVAKKVLAHATVDVLLWRVAEPKPPTLKDEMYYSLQTP